MYILVYVCYYIENPYYFFVFSICPLDVSFYIRKTNKKLVKSVFLQVFYADFLMWKEMYTRHIEKQIIL